MFQARTSYTSDEIKWAHSFERLVQKLCPPILNTHITFDKVFLHLTRQPDNGGRLRKVTYQKLDGTYRIDFSKFHSTHPVSCSKLSAKSIDDLNVFNFQLNVNFLCEF